VDDKIHARYAPVPNSLVTQQPLGTAKAQQGGTAAREMEGLGFGGLRRLLNTLQELLPPSNRTTCRAATRPLQRHRPKGKPIPRPGTPESFKVLCGKLQSLGLVSLVYNR